jgi:hypothetical protein
MTEKLIREQCHHFTQSEEEICSHNFSPEASYGKEAIFAQS